MRQAEYGTSAEECLAIKMVEVVSGRAQSDAFGKIANEELRQALDRAVGDRCRIWTVRMRVLPRRGRVGSCRWKARGKAREWQADKAGFPVVAELGVDLG